MNLSDQRQTVALILIGFGALWLLSTLNLVSSAVLGVLLGYWPVLLIGIGLDILLDQRPFGVPYTGLAFAGLAVFALAGAPGTNGKLSAERFGEPLGNATSAEIELNLGSAPTTLEALGDAANLLDATIRDDGRISLSARGNEHKRLELVKNTRGVTLGRSNANRYWQVGLSPNVPLELSVDAASGSSTLDLTGLNLSELDIELGSGSSEIILPENENRYAFDLEGASGSSDITLPPGADVQLEADMGSGPSHFELQQGAYIDFNLSSGSGPITLDVADGSNVKLVVEDDGSGALTLPGWLTQLEGDEEEGVWQTEGFEPDRGQIIITIEDRGSGSITLR